MKQKFVIESCDEIGHIATIKADKKEGYTVGQLKTIGNQWNKDYQNKITTQITDSDGEVTIKLLGKRNFKLDYCELHDLYELLTVMRDSLGFSEIKVYKFEHQDDK
jgi:hypothetical protein